MLKSRVITSGIWGLILKVEFFRVAYGVVFNVLRNHANCHSIVLCVTFLFKDHKIKYD